MLLSHQLSQGIEFENAWFYIDRQSWVQEIIIEQALIKTQNRCWVHSEHNWLSI